MCVFIYFGGKHSLGVRLIFTKARFKFSLDPIVQQLEVQLSASDFYKGFELLINILQNENYLWQIHF